MCELNVSLITPLQKKKKYVFRPQNQEKRENEHSASKRTKCREGEWMYGVDIIEKVESRELL